jgi:hypothetical protein
VTKYGPWLGAAAALGLLSALLVSASGATAPPPSAAPAPGLVAGGPDAGVLSPTVKITFMTVPPEKATVFWGRKPLGIIKGPKKPLIVERPRDSGPMDVVIKADKFVPVHTRAYTFTDTKMFVKITPIEDKKTIFGYREELPDGGGDGGGPDGGAAPAVGPAPPMGPPAPVGPPAAADGGAR